MKMSAKGEMKLDIRCCMVCEYEGERKYYFIYKEGCRETVGEKSGEPARDSPGLQSL